MPDFEDVGAVFGSLDFRFGSLAFGERAAGYDYFGGVEADEVAGGFFAQANVGAGYDDGLAGAVGGGDGWMGEELAVDHRRPVVDHFESGVEKTEWIGSRWVDCTKQNAGEPLRSSESCLTLRLIRVLRFNRIPC